MARNPTVYSTQFLSNSVIGNHTESYTVPAGYRAVLRDISGVAIGGSAVTLIYSIAAADATVLLAQVPPQVNTPIHWEGRVVLNAGNQISVSVAGAGTASQWTISGYLLALP